MSFPYHLQYSLSLCTSPIACRISYHHFLIPSHSISTHCTSTYPRMYPSTLIAILATLGLFSVTMASPVLTGGTVDYDLHFRDGLQHVHLSKDDFGPSVDQTVSVPKMR
jgi:hypothetical protein